MRPTRTRLFSAACAIAVSLLGAGEARADIGSAIGTGAFFTSGGRTSAGVIGTLGMGSFPVIPIRPQVTGAYVFNTGGNGANYTVTGEGQFGGKSFFAGAGAGFGRLGPNGGSGFLADGFAGVRIAPYTSIQVRFYGSPGGDTGSATFLGVSFGF